MSKKEMSEKLFDTLAEMCRTMLVKKNPRLEKGALKVEKVKGNEIILAVATGNNVGDSYSFELGITKGPTELGKK